MASPAPAIDPEEFP